ncbi:hypothetical protein T4B_2739 [Trichinella pseudospiralis]|uniref:Uncharacterized protein n=2 Tax=Trichinella pseudospiralis TaxID=6337 RepID=A0A0V1G679_TRIPS|nr:hypothetical protein T4A_10956 [Trichinella pseudospiralis]KRY93831.1 hypothetical protein T4D_13141 [Trichinella pseudospiralis]KRZ34320.1 hypothetical protein T4B_2739 [Trichinella pseudospiralis]
MTKTGSLLTRVKNEHCWASNSCFQENFQESGSDEDFVPEEVFVDENLVISDEESPEEESNSEIKPLIVQYGTFIAHNGTEWTSSKPVQARRGASVDIVDQ